METAAKLEILEAFAASASLADGGIVGGFRCGTDMGLHHRNGVYRVSLPAVRNFCVRFDGPVYSPLAQAALAEISF